MESPEVEKSMLIKIQIIHRYTYMLTLFGGGLNTNKTKIYCYVTFNCFYADRGYHSLSTSVKEYKYI